jgi:hypothetical protein
MPVIQPGRDTAKSGGGSNLMRWIRKILLAMVVIFAVFYLVTRPEDAASAVRNAFGALANAFTSIIKFFTSLAG